MNDMIEKVARAIVGELSDQDGYPWGMDANGKVEYLDQGEVDFLEVARAAIEAMRDLPPELKSAGAEAFFSPAPTTTEEENERAASIFRRVIDAALNGKEG